MICCLNPDCQNPQNHDGSKFCQSCNTPLVPLLRNRFRIIRVLSDEGGFGRTYLAEDTDKLNDSCVVKQLAPKFQGTWAQKKAMELFSQEAKRLQELGEHPQIPTLLAYFKQDNCLYLVQQFIDGNNLLQELRLRKHYKDSDIQSLLLDLLPILKFIHSRGVIHRDIKPENIIRRKRDGRLILIDFGSAKQLTAAVQKKYGTSIGSHGYSAIEQIRDGKAYPASDLFSLGATCFHLLTGLSPFQLWIENGYSWVKNWQDCLENSRSTELVIILDKLLQLDLKNRYQSADEVIKDLSKKNVYGSKKSGIYPKKGKHKKPKHTILRNIFLTLVTISVVGGLGYRNLGQIQTAIFSQFNPLLMPSNKSSTSPEYGEIARRNSSIRANKISLFKTITQADKSLAVVAITPDGNTIVSAGHKEIKLWNSKTGKQIISLSGHTQNINALAISPDGKNLVSAGDDKTIKVWNLQTKKLTFNLVGHQDSVQALAISQDSKTLVSAGDDKAIKVWSLLTGRFLKTLLDHNYWVRSLALSPDGFTLASGSFDKTIKIWNINQTSGQKPTTLLDTTSQTVTSLTFSPDSSTLVSTSRDRQIKFWNIKNKEMIFASKKQNVTSVIFSPDGKTLISGTKSCPDCSEKISSVIKLWDVSTKEEIYALPVTTKIVTPLVLSADGKTLVGGTKDNKINVWEISP
ncbi:protein kinase [Raphidiopsis sp. BLCC-F218]